MKLLFCIQLKFLSSGLNVISFESIWIVFYFCLFFSFSQPLSLFSNYFVTLTEIFQQRAFFNLSDLFLFDFPCFFILISRAFTLLNLLLNWITCFFYKVCKSFFHFKHFLAVCLSIYLFDFGDSKSKFMICLYFWNWFWNFCCCNFYYFVKLAIKKSSFYCFPHSRFFSRNLWDIWGFCLSFCKPTCTYRKAMGHIWCSP